MHVTMLRLSLISIETLMREVLTSSANASNETRLDVSVRDFWQRAFYEVRVF
jgi:hypothetical protein